MNVILFLAMGVNAQAGGNRLLNLESSPSGKTSASTSVPSQTATPATTTTSQTAQTSALAQRAQAAMLQSIHALQAQQTAQNNPAAVLGGLGTVPDGLALGSPGNPNGLVPQGGLPTISAVTGSTTSYNVPGSWTGVGGLSQTTATNPGQTTPTVTDTVTQNKEQALLYWDSFNIGRNTTLDFDQSLGGASMGDWIAFNKVAANVAPSQILGSINAGGQVYVINQNGIIFGGSSQVNVHSLVASSLPINDNLSDPTNGRGLLNNPDLQFLFSQVSVPAGSQGPTPAFNPAPAPTSGNVIVQDSGGNPQVAAASGRDGDVIVQTGAQLSSPTSPEHVGGKIALIGPNVSNAGTISTPDGQTILAAGLQVGLLAHPGSDPSLRGLDVSIGEVSDPSYDGGANVSGAAINSGLIEIPRADLTMAGSTVEQNGVIDSSTSVALNGRIDLLADYNAVPLINGESGFQGASNFYPTASGAVTLGANSLIQILPELSSADTVVGTQLALSSIVNIQGSSIHMGTDALLLAPSAGSGADMVSGIDLGVGAVPLNAGVTLDAGSWLQPGNNGYFFINTNGQAYLDSGATIDVSGSENVDASVTENIIAVQLLGAQLANSPLQRNSPLHGQTIDIDIRQTGNYNGAEWVGTPLADTTGYINLIQHTVGELTTAGGTVAINAGDSMVMQPTATVNVSGGWINYQGGLVQTTKVVTSNGQILDISQATPNLVYDGIYTGFTTASAKWGVSQTVANSLLAGPQYEQGYIQGGNGGSLSVTAPAMALDGNLFGNTVAGPYQRTLSSQIATTFANTTVSPTMMDVLGLPNSGTLSLTFQAANPNDPTLAPYSPSPPNIIFQSDSSLPAAGPFGSALAPQRLAEVDLSPDLVNEDGFGNLKINNGDGNITVPSGVALTTQAGGSISMSGANIDIEGNLSAPGGNLNFTVFDFSPYIPTVITTPAPDWTRGQFTLGASASLSTAGLIIDDLPTSSTSESLPLVTNGGSIAIKSFGADLMTGSTIDASGGVAVSATGKLTYGNGGGIAIQAGQDPNIASLLDVPTAAHPQPALVLDSTLESYSGTKGGSLAIKAPLIQIGGNTLQNGDSDGNTLWLNQTDSNGNLLKPDFFDQGGFASMTLNAIGKAVLNSTGAPTGNYLPAILIAPSTTIAPQVQNLVASINGGDVVLTPTLLPQGLRTPISLNFGSSSVKDIVTGDLLARGDFVMDAGAVIQTDPNGSVSINVDTAAIFGSIIAPGGAISIKAGGLDSNVLFLDPTEALPTIELGAGSLLSTAGTVELTPNPYGYITGSVLPGGTITIDGNIVAEAGAVLNVSGTSGVLDVPPTEAGLVSANQPSSPAMVPTRIDSNGGSIVLMGEQELFTDATLLGAAGAPSAGMPSMAQGGALSVSSGLFLPSSVQTPLDPTLVVTQDGTPYSAGQTVIGNAVVDANGKVIAQRGYFAADSFTSGGFDSLTLGGTVQFQGPVTISAKQNLTVGQGGVILADSPVNLSAAYVDLGMPFQAPLPAGQQPTFIFQAGGAAFYFAPTYGTGQLNVTAANLIDMGNLSLQNIGSVNLVTDTGDIRGDGTLDVACKMYMRAGQIYPTTENSFTVAAYDYAGGTGSITIDPSATDSIGQLPLSAGGTLNIYATTITQGGVLRAPMGTINLGSGGTGSTPVDLLTGSGLPGTPVAVISATDSLTLSPDSVTSVSAVDPVTGQAMVIPYGASPDGVSWIDPAGNNITVAGNGPNALPSKTINISAANVTDQTGATIDISGGGDLYAYQWVNGLGGTKDILSTTASLPEGSFAIIPTYQALYAPYDATSGYVSGSNLHVGDQVYLGASNGLPAGTYTLLPARYALLPGAFLVTPKSGAPSASSAIQPDGSTLVSGYRFNGVNPSQVGQPLLSSFEVDPQSVVRARAEYDNFSANTFFSQTAQASDLAIPRLPNDAGQLVLAATQTMTLKGTVLSQTPSGGLGSEVDIASSDNILINDSGTDASFNGLVLGSANLSAFGADSLLIGGYRSITASGTEVTVTTDNLTVDNAAAPLAGPDVILVSNQKLTVDDGSKIESAGTSSSAETLILGKTDSSGAPIPGSGDGTLLRVGSNSSAETIRLGVNPSDASASLFVGKGAMIEGSNNTAAGSLTLDSTYAISLDSTVVLNAASVNLDSSQISLELAPPAIAPSTVGLVLSGAALSNMQTAAHDLSLVSYSSIDIYGDGQIGVPAASGQYPVASLALHAAEIRGFSDNGGGGAVVINAQNINLDDSVNGTVPGVVAASSGSLTINAATINLGPNQLNIDQYSNVTMNASSAIILEGETKVTQSDGTVAHGTSGLQASNNLTLNTPLVTAGSFPANQAAAAETITAEGGDLVIDSPGTSSSSVGEGLGANLTLVGQNVVANGTIVLPSGSMTLHATTGEISVGGTLNVAGMAQNFNDLTKYTSGGQITLTADSGSVALANGGIVDVSANSGGGNAGTLSVSASKGIFTDDGALRGQSGAAGQGGIFSLDVASISGGSLQPLDSALDAGGFTQSISIRDRTDASVSVDGTVKTGAYSLSVDQGSIAVTGTIDASNVAATDSAGNSILVGGTINLAAWGDVTLASNSALTVEGRNFDNAGKGGSVTLAAGAETNGIAGPGYVNIATGSTINLTVDANNGTADGGNSASLGHLAGTLAISAPQTTGNADLQVNPINGNIVGASSIVVEGYQVFNAVDGSIDNQEANVFANGTTFTGNTAGILGRIYNPLTNSNSAALQAITNIEPGAEIINLNGDLTLAGNWDLSTYRFGPNVNPAIAGSGVPGVLTLRAAGNLVFDFGASLSDGFDPSNTSFASSVNPMWTAPLLASGSQSWSYQMVAGADFGAANINQVLSSTDLQTSGLGGSVLLGKNAPALPTSLARNTRNYVLGTLGYFQAIRTGTGDITVDAGGDVQLLNNLATIYTAGTQAPPLAGFAAPVFGTAPQPPNYGPQYSMDGGNIMISAQGDIAHLTTSGQPDSSLELPTTWLDRQGAVNAAGQWQTHAGKGNHTQESTSWWVDFSNFFEGVGALGGGNVTLSAGGSINNVDAVVPTNARMPELDSKGNLLAPNAANLVELGGGDLVVQAGDNINGGVYYVERGQGALAAGNQILTNATRATVGTGEDHSQPITWLPTTLFLGQGSFDVTAGSDLLLGPVANPFLLPQGANNGVLNKSYFSTYAASDGVYVASLTGAITLKDNPDGGEGSLNDWYSNVYLAPNGQSIATSSQPWLDSAETSFAAFTTVATLMPPALHATAFSGDLDVLGSLTLTPSPEGTIDLVASGSLNGFQVNEVNANIETLVQTWGSSVINLSDANPAGIPGVASPLSSSSPSSDAGVLAGVNALFAESGATQGVALQTKQALHADINGQTLHANDPNPVHLYAQTGDISGFTLFSGKFAQVVAGQDITDIALYIQNVNAGDISVVAAGRDIIAYDVDSPLRLEVLTPGNAYIGQTTTDPLGSGLGGPNDGDIQISGPGTLEVLAGRNLNLGIGPNNSDGTGVGISSVGQARNPTLPFGGADIIAGAGLDTSAGLDDSLMNFGNVRYDNVSGNVVADDPASFGASFIANFLSPATGGAEATRYLPDLGALMGLSPSETGDQVWTAFSLLPAKQQDTLALDIFYDVLRDAGRDHNDPSSPGVGNYNAGMAALKALFPGPTPGAPWPGQGDISLTSREIKTTNGGDISLLAPGGQLDVGLDVPGNQAVDQGILTEDGGNISIFTNGNVNVGTSRIFTLHGGNIIIWSTTGDAAAGNSSKTVQSAPPTRVLVDPQSADVQTDLAGLATGGGIGVLETVVGAPPANVDLIAPNGTINAGDAGIRASGNLNIAAVQVLNAGNISVGGKSSGTPTVTAPNVAGLSAASNTAGATSSAADQAARQAASRAAGQQDQELPSIITVEVLGYGGGDDSQG